MNIFCRRKSFLFLPIIVAALVFGARDLYAQQQPEARYDNRVLLVYDTAWSMKARLPKTRAATLELLSILVQRGELRNGDTLGIWTFSTDVSAGKFPLQTWQLSAGDTILSNIMQFVDDQKYHGSTHFDKLMLMIPGLVENSDRLTVVIFCDGDGHFAGTPFDLPINGIFGQQRKTAHQTATPFLVILRSQLGKYAGCRVDLPPQMDVPFFPEFPAPPVPLFTPEKTNEVAKTVTPPAPPLLIVGTNIYTGQNALTNHPQPAPKIIPTNPPPTATNSMPAKETNAAKIFTTNVVTITNVVEKTNIVQPAVPTNQSSANPAISTNPTNAEINQTQTNVVPAGDKNSGRTKGYAIAGAIFLAAAVGLGIVLLQRHWRHKNSSSLITRSMNKK